MKRREFLGMGAYLLGASAFAPAIAFANIASDARFIFIIQRGAADGLNSLIPYGDPNYTKLRPELAIKDGQKLDGMFALHPALQNIGTLYAQNQALLVHATASPYRERSHFDGQNILEGGFSRAYQSEDGWINRFLAMAPHNGADPIAFAPTIPLALRGKNSVTSYYPSQMPQANDDFLSRIGAMYENDPQLYNLWLKAAALKDMGAIDGNLNPQKIGQMVGEFMNKPNGARFAMLETTGWDTHSAQNTRLQNGLKSLDDLIGAIKTNLGDNWQNTTILIATEFGRTAAQNGTNGTDHGTASCAYLLGGAIKKSKIIADWPGLGAGNLYENRDLKPTTDLFGFICASLGQTYNIEPQKIAQNVFGLAGAIKPIQI